MPTEDSQPNESRVLPKGAGVPAIRSAQPRRPFGRFRGSSRGTGPRPNPPRFQSGHSRIVNADLSSDFSHVTHSASHIVSYNVHPSSSGSSSYPLFQPPNPAIGPLVPFPDTFIPGPSHQADYLPDSHLNENLDPISNVRIGHSISSSNPGGTPNENKRRVANEQELRRPRKRANKSSEKLEEQVFDVPENCRKGVIDSRMARIQFDRCIVDGLKEHTGAKIHSKRFEGDRFIVIYTAPPIPAVIKTESVSQPTSDVSMPSGSDTKLEDLILLSESRPPSRSPPTGSILPSQLPSATIDENNSRSFVIEDEETVMRLPNRPILSGVLSLSYGPQRESVRTPLPSVEAKPRSPEVIEIEDSPPPSPLVKKEKEAATYDIVAAIRERAKVAASLCLKKETADSRTPPEGYQ
ncbi:hypothetical protein DFH11DRAFT_340876 [Phellopilus nigrolimitatus]|nr:hypothetical protein DFH11DRAFT_340876 [Phellopilus nigrolimitatus]